MFPCLLVDTVTITEATQLEITVLQLKCVTGCSFLSPFITTLTCHRLREEQEQLSPTHTADTIAAAATAQFGLSVL